MIEEQTGASAAPAWRPPWWLVAVLLVFAVGAGFGAGALVWAGGSDEPASAHQSPYDGGFPVLSPEDYEKCVRQVVVNFNGDDADPAMRAAADQLRDDPRFESVRERTRQESYEEFKEIFADEPELLESARPESLPASVLVMVRKGSTAKQVKGALGEEFPDAEITVQDYCPRPQ